jgi:hypothetical protein
MQRLMALAVKLITPPFALLLGIVVAMDTGCSLRMIEAT